MGTMEVTSMSSRGQVVIPQDIREQLHLKTGEKFVVVGEDGTVILKRIEMPSFKDFDSILKKTQEFARKTGLKKKNVAEAIKRVRQG